MGILIRIKVEYDLPNIFERYYKGKRSDGKKSSGTGLGLAIVKSILEMQQVSYGVESELGQGTTFWFELIKDKSHTSFGLLSYFYHRFLL